MYISVNQMYNLYCVFTSGSIVIGVVSLFHITRAMPLKHSGSDFKKFINRSSCLIFEMYFGTF